MTLLDGTLRVAIQHAFSTAKCVNRNITALVYKSIAETENTNLAQLHDGMSHAPKMHRVIHNYDIWFVFAITCWVGKNVFRYSSRSIGS